ncbi:collagen alpha-1(I) chain-like [Stylophora pistillata]|uniref:collagen alpha-1(I) chain-like n=1 Tax=Stylophora pistillata TaxID=50429 RepID=UPI000C045C5F|nr:collagen alpha-1(I) chain-like [Stylophora pistillata]
MNYWVIVLKCFFLSALDMVIGADRGCKTVRKGDESYSESITIPKMKWTETPAIVSKGKREYQVIGRVVHMNYVREYLAAKENMKFGNVQRKPNRIQLEVLADTVYIEGLIRMRGIKKLTVYSRKVVSGKDSQLDVRAPTLSPPFDTSFPLAPGTPGVPGQSGVAGPKVEVYTQLSEGHMYITNNGGNGNQGQKGADGKNGVDRIDGKPPRTFAQCKANRCRTVPGWTGDEGNPGKDGGNAGTSGDGGQAGKQRIYMNEVIGSIKLKTCPGQGGAAPINGKGGIGGLGSLGGTGFRCAMRETCVSNPWAPLSPSCHTSCRNEGATGRASRGARGPKGKDGTS